MKKLSIYRSFIYLSALAVCIVAFAKLDSGIGRNYSELKSYKTMLGEVYDTPLEVCVRARFNEQPLWCGEPEGYYLYTGYIGSNMTEEDLKGITVLDDGPVAEEAYNVIDRCREKIWHYIVLELLVIASGICLVGFAAKRFL